MSGTVFAFLPAVIAIALALLTKKVYPSLFLGVLVGALLYTKGNPIEAFIEIVNVMSERIGSNGGILIFLVVLGIFAVLFGETGASAAYGNWAQKRIKTKRGALLSTFGLGALIFVDDYFNCLTVGSVMRPVTDRHGISRAKLAYIIDSTAAPICIIAPISSWAAAVADYYDGDGIVGFIKTIPFNLYALLTVAMIIVLSCIGRDFGKMRKNEIAAENGDLLAGETELPSDDIPFPENAKGKVRHLLIPIGILIVCCVLSLIYVGFQGTGAGNVIEAFSQTDATLALGLGSMVALVITIVYLLICRVVTFSQCNDSLVKGFRSMVPAVFILVFAWTLSAFMGAKGGYLDAKLFIEENLSNSASFEAFLPAIFFLLACAISFATGTSWGTFAILLTVATPIVAASPESMVFLTYAAVLAGAVFGDHVSPISDTTIMASSGAQCNHLDHVRTQLPYAGLVAAVSFVTYVIAGLIVGNANVPYGAAAALTLGIGAVLLAGALVFILLRQKKAEAASPAQTGTKEA